MRGKRKKSQRHFQQRRTVPTENFLEELIKKILEKLNNSDYQPTVSDAIKAIQVKQKLNKTSDVEKIFWELIDKIRKEELEKMESNSRGEQDES
jgi:hypothetical protein